VQQFPECSSSSAAERNNEERNIYDFTNIRILISTRRLVFHVGLVE